MINFALVTEVFPQEHAVKVVYRDLVVHGRGQDRKVQVLSHRAHATGGFAVGLPQVGELGLVLEVDARNSVWIGSVHQGSKNQLPGERFLEGAKHESGAAWQVRRNGDLQLDHPSGLCLRVVETGGDPDTPGSKLDALAGETTPPINQTPAPWVVLDHPAMGSVKIHPDGKLEILHASGGSITVDADGNLAFAGFASTHFQEATKRFVMEPILAWLRTHTHAGVTSGSSATTAPVQSLSDDAMLTPASFKGPQGA